MGAGDGWGSRDPGPAVRPYALTGGRTEPADGEMLDVIAVVVAAVPAEPDGKTEDPAPLVPEYLRILSLCRQPTTVADLASDTALPLGVIRVLLADLTAQGRITVVPQRPVDEQPSADLLREVLHGLRAL
ncbi:MAG TPA: DUF742 domain-containing protein [Streptosporangiaceae bacterium]|nr:DUF742 domain-containing protein [Streptosporangiaceae bacterium]